MEVEDRMKRSAGHFCDFRKGSRGLDDRIQGVLVVVTLADSIMSYHRILWQRGVELHGRNQTVSAIICGEFDSC